MSLSATTLSAGRILGFNRNVCFLSLEVLSSDGFRVSRVHENTLDFDDFFRCVQGQGFVFVSKFLELSAVKGQKRSKGSHFTPLFVAVEREPLRELRTEPMR